MEQNPPRDTEEFRDHIATVDEEGKRKWMFPIKPKGKFTSARQYLSYVYLALLFAGPWIRVNGEPFVLLNIMERKFILFGKIFWPQDFYLFALSFITGVLFIVLFTVVYGRLFCGWVCPQTVFMEMVFRRIEYWIEGDAPKQRKLQKMPWNWEKIRKTGLKHVIFFGISVLIANTFLAYIIGSDELLRIQLDDPREHMGGLTALLIFSGVFYGVFAWFREQVCIAVCPYGRLQGVMLDRNSVVVAYDYKRGESRAPFRGKRENREELDKGDCIDCHKCVDVCPTGIDIRNGTQLECVNCTACIDACDSMMDRVGFDRGLIRYASEEQIATGKEWTFSNRAKAYTGVLVILLGVIVSILVFRADVKTTVLRAQGMLYQQVDETHLSNLYNYKIINKTNVEFPVEFRIADDLAEIRKVGNQEVTVPASGKTEGAFFIVLDEKRLDGLKTKIKVDVYRNDERIDDVEVSFMGPMSFK